MEDSPRKINSHTESSNAADAACSDTVEDMDTSGPEPLTLPAEVFEVYVISVNGSTNSVIVRFIGEDFSDQLDHFEGLLQREFTKEQLQPITPGMMCVAYYEGCFNRAQIVSIEDEKVNCFLPDHGLTASLTSQHLRQLDPEVNRKLPYQAVEVSLHGIEHLAENPTAISTLRDLTYGHSCIAVAIDWYEYETSLSVVLFDTTGDININEEIKIRCQRRRSDISSRGL